MSNDRTTGGKMAMSKPDVPPFDLDSEPEPAGTWPGYLAERFTRLPTAVRVFGMIFVALLVIVVFAGLTLWFFEHGWMVPGVISGCATVAAAVTAFAALITEGFDL